MTTDSVVPSTISMATAAHHLVRMTTGTAECSEVHLVSGTWEIAYTHSPIEEPC